MPNYILCINLKRRPDRRKTAAKMLQALSFPYEFVDAVDGKNIDLQYMKKHKIRTYPGWKLVNSKHAFYSRDIKAGEIGCALSHIKAWQVIVKKNLDYAIIFEDDAKPRRGFKTAVVSTFKEFKKRGIPWDLLYLCRFKVGARKERTLMKDIVTPHLSHCAVAYGLSQSGARKLLAAHLEKNIIAVDEFLPAMYNTHPRKDIQKLYSKCEKLIAYSFRYNLAAQGRDTDTERSGFPGKQLKETSILRTTDQVRFGWLNGNIYILTASAKGLEIDHKSKKLGSDLFFLLEGFSKKSTLAKILKEADLHTDASDLLKLSDQLVSMGALQVVKW